MARVRGFWPEFWEAAYRSRWVAGAGLALTIFSLAGGSVLWLAGLSKWAAFGLMAIATPIVAWLVYHVASLAWLKQVEEAAGLRGQLKAVMEAQPNIRLGQPSRLEHGDLPRTEVRGTIETSVGTRGPRQRMVIRWSNITNYRIPITNDGAAAQEVRVKVIEFQPQVEGVSEEVTLHIAHDDPPLENYTFESSFPLARGETVHMDVVAMDEERPEVCYLWNIAFEDAVQQVKLGGTHWLKIRAYAGDVSAEARYRVYADALDRRLEMEGPLKPNEG
jgi:hypothetical protein